MIKFVKMFSFLCIIFFLSNSVIAEEKKDCSQYSSKTLEGLMDKRRCKAGLNPSKKSLLGSLKYKKFDTTKPCDEYSTKTFAGLMGKMRCKKEK